MLSVEPSRRDALVDFLLKQGVDAKVHYPIPMHLQQASAYLGYKRGDFPVAEAHAASVFTLPVHQHMTAEQKQYCIEMVQAYFKGTGC